MCVAERKLNSASSVQVLAVAFAFTLAQISLKKLMDSSLQGCVLNIGSLNLLGVEIATLPRETFLLVKQQHSLA